MKKLTEKQSKTLQIILGLAAGLGIWWSIYIGIDAPQTVLQYLFVIIFAAIMLIKNYLEKKLQTRYLTFTKFWLIGLVIGLAIVLIIAISSGKLFTS